MFNSIPLQGARGGAIPAMTLACGVMVANVYLCQPLLAEMAQSFGSSARTAALVAVLAQVGYAMGILLVVPLADVADSRVLVPRLLLLSALGLMGAALSPSMSVLLLLSAMVASTSIVAQILIPMATTLGAPEYRGRIVSALSTGLTLGIVLSRTYAGLVAHYADSWRASYVVQACLVMALWFILPRYLPASQPRARDSTYFGLLRSLPSLLRLSGLRLSIALGFLTFAAFSAFWATLSFHLASPAFHLGSGAAGLFGIWGIPGVLLSPLVGKVIDRAGPTMVSVISVLAVALSFGVALLWGSTSIAALVITVVLISFGAQCAQIANQTRIFGLGDGIRGRLNTLYMVGAFSGGALGALAGGYAWQTNGWRGVCLLGIGLIATAAVFLLTSLSTATKTATPKEA